MTKWQLQLVRIRLPSIISNMANDVITEYSRLSSLLAVRDDSQERRLPSCQFHTDVVKSLIYESGQERYCSRMENKRSQRWNGTSCNTFFRRRIWSYNLSFPGSWSQKYTKRYHNRPGKQNWTNFYLEPLDYRINNVNIDLRRQFGISVAEANRNVPNGDEREERAIFAGSQLQSSS